MGRAIAARECTPSEREPAASILSPTAGLRQCMRHAALAGSTPAAYMVVACPHRKNNERCLGKTPAHRLARRDFFLAAKLFFRLRPTGGWNDPIHPEVFNHLTVVVQ